jgi:hypothetical protein
MVIIGRAHLVQTVVKDRQRLESDGRRHSWFINSTRIASTINRERQVSGRFQLTLPLSTTERGRSVLSRKEPEVFVVDVFGKR